MSELDKTLLNWESNEQIAKAILSNFLPNNWIMPTLELNLKRKGSTMVFVAASLALAFIAQRWNEGNFGS